MGASAEASERGVCAGAAGKGVAETISCVAGAGLGHLDRV